MSVAAGVELGGETAARPAKPLGLLIPFLGRPMMRPDHRAVDHVGAGVALHHLGHAEEQVTASGSHSMR